jgi:hypothetical protein
MTTDDPRRLPAPTPARAELAERFWSYVVRGPHERDCWIWTGAIADDGYGRFWVSAQPSRVVAPHRFVVELVTGRPLDEGQIVEHAVCDNPICVRFAATHQDQVAPDADHLMVSTQAANLARMGRLGRGGGAWSTYRWRSTDRASLAARSRRLRDAVRGGWDEDRIRAALEEPPPGQPALW